jgi:predicted DNA-binding transcriptional regulator YafY
MPLRSIPKPRLPRLGRPHGHFTQHRRLDKLKETLEQSPDGMALEDLAMILHVTTRSVRRYLHELSLLVDLESLPTTPGGVHLWRIKPSERGRSVALRRTQAYGLLAARLVFEVLRGSALFDELDVTMREVLQIARRPTRGAVKGEVPSDQRLEERFLFVPPPARSYAEKAEELDDLFQAVAELRVLSFRYRAQEGKARRGHDEHVTAHPYAMVLHEGAILCVGLHVALGEVSVFAFDRMRETRASADEHFRIPEGFDVRQCLHGAFGVLAPAPRGAKATRVVVEFEARAAEDLRWARVHPTQKIATAADGRLRLSLVASDLDAVRAWVLRFGGAARVVEPPELARAVADELRRALARYA